MGGGAGSHACVTVCLVRQSGGYNMRNLDPCALADEPRLSRLGIAVFLSPIRGRRRDGLN
jgi:hypothetical protein